MMASRRWRCERRPWGTLPSWLLLCCSLGLGVAEIIPGVLERVILAPNRPYHVTVPLGEAKFLAYSCMGGPADVIISLSTFAQHADPLLFLSTNPDANPSFKNHEASSFGQWQEDDVGTHYVMAKAVNPKGGILGLVNLRHFGGQYGEALDGILRIHCTFIIAFDALFWDHLRNSAVCPLGIYFEDGRLVESPNFCSGHGHCNKHAECSCDGDWTGPACEHSKKDIVVAADGRYRFKVATGKYQYFRIRIPPDFPGGYLEIKLLAESPLIVLVRGDDLPTKSNFELSNFDDWLNGRAISDLKYKISDSAMMVPPGGALPPPMLPPVGAPMLPPVPPMMPGVGGLPPPLHTAGVPGGATGGRRLLDSLRGAGAVDSWSEFYARAKDFHDGVDEIPEMPVRRLSDMVETQGSKWQATCPNIAPDSLPACRTPAFKGCQSSCQRCMGCVKGGDSDHGCTQACDDCVNPRCMDALAECAGDRSCTGDDARQCEAGCGRCMECFDSNDDRCQGCHCCIRCLPLAAKCSISPSSPLPYNRFAFVGVYNHPKFRKDKAVIAAAADITLTEDVSYSRTELPPSWIAELYDKFHDIRTLEITQKGYYPDGGQFVYEIDTDLSATKMQVRLYRDRLTLLRLSNTGDLKLLKLRFASGPAIDHILSSSVGAPKTLFDFDQKHETAGGMVTVRCRSTVVWIALFASLDGFTELSFSMVAEEREGPAVGFALVCVFGFLCALLVLALIYGGAQKLGDLLGMDPNMPLMERLGCLVRNVKPHESTASLTRTGSLTGYIGSDVIDRSVEDQYLHRGGTGDDGI